MIIGVSGKIGAGKDATASWLVKNHGFQIVRFSDALKEEVLRILPKTCVEIWRTYWGLSDTPTDEELRQMLWETKPPIIRRLLQEWGTELRRHENPVYWIDRWTDKVRALSALGISVVAPDVRFLNEAEAVHALGGHVLRIDRPGLPVGDHVSELEGDKITYDHVIANTGTLDDLAVRVDRYLARV